MADKKRQHYVPRFYLKNFSINSEGKAIGIFNVEKNVFILRGNLNNQAYKHYFYGKDDEIENLLGAVEFRASSIIKNIIIEESLPEKMKADHYALLVFTLFQWARTLYTADTANEMIEKFIKQIAQNTTEYKNLADKIKIKQHNPGALPLELVMTSIPLLYNLNFILFINNTDVPFITSDHPVVLYNQFLEEKRVLLPNITGLAAKGLQIFLPISPKQSVCFYDQDVYNFVNPVNRTIKLSKAHDVDALNQLQCINSYTNLYFGDNVSNNYLCGLFSEVKKYRRTSKANVMESQMEKISENKYRSFSLIYSYDVRINLKLSFISIKKSAKRSKLGDKALIVRDEWLFNAERHFSKLVSEGKYAHGEFGKFLEEYYRE